ncbi:DNA polymerase III subunit gamma/tau [Shewanella sp. UCD-KL12]|uniref:DNA polymerase III subunit gamma/tau n=1 Tax=Shewanella sp. UCD-KL12 TaxID=1917163 RepID=UPI0009FB4E48|nr:DNA polymerase III subunit gamma/tau [Shewanella sp. UCD-KL12]
MSYQVLARKWRPATFEQMVGQSHVLHALTNALSQQRLHHAYLFSGTRGVGKTSLARLFAKGLNCEQGVTASPCGQCSSCVEISEGRFVDLIEVDAASRTKVDDTRELLDNVQYRPSRGRYKVYLIDEVHMLSRSSFNALLKTLEEPPEHVKFLLATTDPQRLPVTVLSRCLQFNLKSLTQEEIANQLSHVLGQEQIEFDKPALSLLAKSANGSMRDALSLADQSIAFGAGKVHLAQVQTMLGSIDEQHVISLLEALVQGDIPNLMQLVDKVISFGADSHEVLRSLLELLHQITLSQFAPAAAQLSIYSKQITAFSEQLSPEQVQLYYQLLLAGRKDLPHAPDPKSGLEMALLRAVAFVPETPVTRWVVEKPVSITLSEVDATHAATDIEQTVSVKSESSAQQVNPSAPSDEQEEADDSGVLNSLDSEQALILSQAASQGMVQADISPVTTKSETASISNPLNSAENLDASASKPVIAEEVKDTANTSIALAGSELVETEVVESEQEVTSELATSVAKSELSSEPSHDTARPTNHYDEQYLVQAQAQDDQFDYQQQDYQQQDYQQDNQQDGMSSEDYLPFDSLPATQGTAGTNGVEAVNLAQQGEQESSAPLTAASEHLNAEEDILDAVLAARDSLLTDLAKKPEESGGKKPEAQRKEFVPPKRKPDAEPQVAAKDTTEEPDTAIAKPGTSASTQPPVTQLPVNSDIEDRPPWEEQESEQDSLLNAPVLNEPVLNEQALNEPALNETGVNKAANIGTRVVEGTQSVAAPAVQNNSSIEAVQIDGSSVDHFPPLGEGEVTGNEIDLKWYRLMTAIDVGGRVRQLAVNSVCHQFTQPLSLLLKPNQKHLAAEIAIVQLEEALSRALETDECKVNITVGLDEQRETPLEIRQRFHREIQSQAHHCLVTDINIQWLVSQMDAELEPDSLSYSPELLSLKGNSIELIDKSNFKALPQS